MSRVPSSAAWRLQLAVLLLAGVLWSIYPYASFGAMVVAYALAWLALNVARAWRRELFDVEIGRARGVALVIVLAAAPVARGASLVDNLLENEHIDSIEHQTSARMWLEDTPSIFPPLVSADRPQTFYVHAPGASRVNVELGRATLTGAALGHGLFRIELFSMALAERADTVDVTLVVDGDRHTRTLRYVRPYPHPRWLRPSPDRTHAVTVSEETDELIIVNEDGVVRRESTDDAPVDALFLGERVIVAYRYSPRLSATHLSENGGPSTSDEIGHFSVHLATDGDGLAVTRAGRSPELVVLDSQLGIERRIPLEFTPEWVVMSEDHIVVSSRQPAALHRFSRTDWSEDRAPIQLGRPVVTMSELVDGVVDVAVTDYQTDGPQHLGNHFVVDQILTIDVAHWHVVARLPTAIRTSRQSTPGGVDRGVSPMGIDRLPDGTRWVAFAGTDDVWRYREHDVLPDFFVLDDHPLAAPISVVAFANGHIAVSSATYGSIGVFTTSGHRVALHRFAPNDHELIQGDQHGLQRRIGERVFYESTRSGVSCQSCHLHGDSDGQRHNIGGNTFVATLDTRGLLGTPPFLRDGGYPLLGGLDELAQTLYGGYLRHQGGRRISLDRYLGSLARPTPPRQLDGRDAERERRGLDAFVEARCPVCHSFPAFTNLGQHPAETIFPDFADSHPGYELDTASLLGLGESAPYLVDGRAPTLLSIFEDHDGARRHGNVSELSDEELADLVHFLEGL